PHWSHGARRQQRLGHLPGRADGSATPKGHRETSRPLLVARHPAALYRKSAAAQRRPGDASARIRRPAAHSGLPRAAAPPWPSPEPAQSPGAVGERTLISYRLPPDRALLARRSTIARGQLAGPRQRLNRQTSSQHLGRYAAKFAPVVRHQRELTKHRLSGNQRVKGSDRCSGSLEARGNLRIRRRILGGELQNAQGAQKILHAPTRLLGVRALGRARAQLGFGNDAHGDVGATEGNRRPLFKGNAEGLAVQFATCRNVTDDRTEAGDEQSLYRFTALRLRALLCRFH